ncbi:class 1 fructose-bisphosphatase [Paracoccus sp. R12_1]|uniref:class 1 fructose-bisphosphatase n=1 Tax=unclassified Paracoccus (in: a-proteobacteria) TaxID=2688777 RepID=UPI001ADBFBE5|nr:MULTISPECIES: class 1 fructose-bisphosphatase [unclassified Paracoccus (in: a-proteobacteria)]MBO9456105.1 class 1 fructose-bisphosphatase [Paracoccus sp. R12_2]MBO9487078.1 class 1 fructose-bisphosphatase [Paracoccus sp. R12_1]
MSAPSIDTTHVPAPLRPLMLAMARGAAEMAGVIRRGDRRMAAEMGVNSNGDGQKRLDLDADALFRDALRHAGLRWYASEELCDPVAMQDGGDWALAIDPLDGSSNIDTNVSIGTIFAVYPAGTDANASFLRPARELICGGYVIYGPRCSMVVSFGDGTQIYALNPDTGCFDLTDARLSFPDTSFEFAINASNYRHWPRPVRAYIDDCLAGTDGPRDKNFNMRWIGSLVAEAHRILMRGGIFLYPADDRPGYGRGRLRMLYECAPIAFLIEQAGGRATDGALPILDARVTALHGRTPFVFGSADKVNRVAAYHDLPEAEVSALFGNRGLFRA